MRVTEKVLRNKIKILAKLVRLPEESYRRLPDGRYISQNGALNLEFAYNRVRLVQIVGESGGVRAISPYMTRSQLNDTLSTMIEFFHQNL